MFGTITLNSFEGFKGFSHSGGVMSLPPDPPHYYYGYKNNLTRINQTLKSIDPESSSGPGSG